jgi:hypothetical protein
MASYFRKLESLSSSQREHETSNDCIGVLVFTPVCILSVETQQCFG